MMMRYEHCFLTRNRQERAAGRVRRDDPRGITIRKEDAVTTRPKPVRGFSLIELLTVITIIMIVAAIAIPMGLSYVRNYEMLGAAQNVASQIQLARAQAVRRNSRRGILLNFDYPAARQYQFTTLDENPMTGGWDGSVYPSNPGVFDPNNRDNYGTAPAPPNNHISPGNDPQGKPYPSPHGNIVELPVQIDFDNATYSSLLFRADGSVEAVTAQNVPGRSVAADANGLDWLVTIRNQENGLVRQIRVSRNGRVAIETP